jgi:uncharacterized membrane protein YhaH (DUF805 family)
MADVFVSYAREDRARAELMARNLEAAGYDVFWDNEIPPGQTWADYTEAKLGESKVTLVLWTAASVASQWVREEARMARDKGKLIPVLLDGTPPPFGFGEVQGADLSQWRGEQTNAAWARVLSAINAATGGPSLAPNPALARTPAQGAPFSSPPADASALSPIGYIQKCLRLYVNANGRARRAEYWWWVAFAAALALIAALIDGALGAAPGEGPVGVLVGLAIALPGVCVGVRRFHDVGLSGWWFAAAFGGLVIAGALGVTVYAALGGLLLLAIVAAMLFVLVRDGQPGANRYGPNPKGR